MDATYKAGVTDLSSELEKGRTGIYILAIHPPLGGGEFLSKVKNREEFGKGGKIRKKEKRVIKHTLEYLNEE